MGRENGLRLSNASARTRHQNSLVDHRKTLSPCCVKFSSNCQTAGSRNSAQIGHETVSAIHSTQTDSRDSGRLNAYPSAEAVYGSDAMESVKAFVGLTLMLESAPVLLSAIELRGGALKAWDDYVQSAGLHMQARLDSQRPFLWTDEFSNRTLQVPRGEIVVAPLVGHGTQNVPGGLIHAWIGAVFIPNATFESALAIVHGYDRYKDLYKPVVVGAKLLACTAMDRDFSMNWQRRVLFVNAAMEGQYRAHDFAVDARRGYSIADTRQVQEIGGYGHSGEHLLPPDQGNGYIWRLHSIARCEQRDGGVYLELEAVVKHLSINSLTATLRQTPDAVSSLSGQPGPLCKESLR